MTDLRKWVIGTLAVASMVSMTVQDAGAGAVTSNLNYLQVKFGTLQPDSDLDDNGYDTGLAGSLTYGRYLNDYLIIEGVLELSGTDSTVRSSNTTVGRYKLENDILTDAVYVTIKGEYAVGPVDFFGGGGVGLYVAELDSDIETERFGDFTTDESEVVFGVHFVAGINYNFNKFVFAGLEGMYRWTDDVDISENVVSVPVEYYGDLNGYIITLNCGLRF